MLGEQGRRALQHARAGFGRRGIGEVEQRAFLAPGFGDEAAVPPAGVEGDDKGVFCQGLRSPARLASTVSR